MISRRLPLLAWILLWLAAQEVSAALQGRAEQVVRMLNGGENAAEMFHADFLAQEQRFAALMRRALALVR